MFKLLNVFFFLFVSIKLYDLKYSIKKKKITKYYSKNLYGTYALHHLYRFPIRYRYKINKRCANTIYSKLLISLLINTY